MVNSASTRTAKIAQIVLHMAATDTTNKHTVSLRKHYQEDKRIT